MIYEAHSRPIYTRQGRIQATHKPRMLQPMTTVSLPKNLHRLYMAFQMSIKGIGHIPVGGEGGVLQSKLSSSHIEDNI